MGNHSLVQKHGTNLPHDGICIPTWKSIN